MTTSDSWCSPPEIADPLEEFFDGPVEVDPCSNERSIIRAHVTYRFGGLVLPWRLPASTCRTVYQNDPYSKAGAWTDKMLSELAVGNVRELVRLSMMSTTTGWWSRMCYEPKRNPRILGIKRVAFLDPRVSSVGGKRQVCRFEPALTYIGPRTRDFTRVFAHLTNWATWGRD